MHDPYMTIVEKAEYIQHQGYRLVTVWERQIHRQLAADEEMARYFDQHEAVTPLEFRLAFYGGRTTAIKLYHTCGKREKIRYVQTSKFFFESVLTGVLYIDTSTSQVFILGVTSQREPCGASSYYNREF